MTQANEGIRPNRTELWIRFLCGFVLGGLLGLGWAVNSGSGSIGEYVLGASAGGLMAGFLARHFGDRFWKSWRIWLP